MNKFDKIALTIIIPIAMLIYIGMAIGFLVILETPNLDESMYMFAWGLFGSIITIAAIYIICAIYAFLSGIWSQTKKEKDKHGK